MADYDKHKASVLATQMIAIVRDWLRGIERPEYLPQAKQALVEIEHALARMKALTEGKEL